MSIAEGDAFEKFLRDVWATWLAGDATPVQGGGRTRPPQKEWGVSPILGMTLFGLCSSLLKREDLPSGFTFDAQTRTLQFTAEAFMDFVRTIPLLHELRDDQMQRLLYEDEGLWKRVVRLVTHWYEEWRNNALDWSTIVGEALAERTRECLGIEAAEIRFPGVFVVGYAGAEHRWGLRTEEQLRQLMGIDDVTGALAKLVVLRAHERADLLQQATPVTSQMVTERPVPETVVRPDLKDLNALRLTANREYDLLLVQAIHSVEYFGVSPAPDYLVQQIVEAFTPNAATTTEARAWKYREALFRLEEEDWVEQDRRLPKAWRTHLKPDWRNLLLLPEWVLRHRDRVKKQHWQALLGAQAVQSIFKNEELLLRMVDAVAPTLSMDDDVLTTYAEKLADAASTVRGRGGERLLHRAEELLRGFTGESSHARKAWVTIASKHLKSSIRAPEFYLAVAMLDDEGLVALVQSDAWELRHDFERIAWGAIRAGHVATVRRLATTLDAVPDHWFKDRRYMELLQQWCDEAAHEETDTDTVT